LDETTAIAECRIMSTETAACLRRVDPARNMARFYKISVAQSLFGDVAIVREWGRIGTIGRMRIDLFANEKAALTALEAIGRAKIRRGYRDMGSGLAVGVVIDPKPQTKKGPATACSAAGPLIERA
jgi:predicted DNA-binding WGR domain protein